MQRVDHQAPLDVGGRSISKANPGYQDKLRSEVGVQGGGLLFRVVSRIELQALDC